MLLNVFCFLFLFRLFSFLVEMCIRNAKWHCVFTRSQPADPKFHCKIWYWKIIIVLVYQWCYDQIFNPKVCSLLTLKFINDELDVLQHYHLKYSVTYAAIFRGYCFLQEVWKQKPSETGKDIIKIFEERLQKSTETYSEFTVKYLR